MDWPPDETVSGLLALKPPRPGPQPSLSSLDKETLQLTLKMLGDLMVRTVPEVGPSATAAPMGVIPSLPWQESFQTGSPCCVWICLLSDTDLYQYEINYAQ